MGTNPQLVAIITLLSENDNLRKSIDCYKKQDIIQAYFQMPVNFWKATDLTFRSNRVLKEVRVHFTIVSSNVSLFRPFGRHSCTLKLNQ